MNQKTAKPLIGFLVLIVVWHISAPCVSGLGPEIAYQQKPPEVNSTASTSPTATITQQGEALVQQVDQFKQGTKRLIKVTKSIVTESAETLRLLGDWVLVQADWAKKQLQDLTGIYSKR